MNKKLNCILLIDDDDATNFIHQVIIKKAKIAEQVVTTLNGKQGLDFLTNSGKYHNKETPLPSIVFLDINMPVMDGWEFMEAYQGLSESMKNQICLVKSTILTGIISIRDCTQAPVFFVTFRETQIF